MQLSLSSGKGFGFQQQEARLPRWVSQVGVPPIKCQGIKTKLVNFILSSIQWPGSGRWIEPFAGSGVVALNVVAMRALLADTNVHMIRFYRDVAEGHVTPASVRLYLEREGLILAERGDDYYYEVRERFNSRPSSHDFLFLNRACFNGVMRFNRKGEFNVPFGKKRDRFRPAYVTKIFNQVARVAKLLPAVDWEFQVADWRETLSRAQEGDFVYADPPYIGRHTGYYNSWTCEEAKELVERLRRLPCGFALSMWKENKYRKNPYLPTELPDTVIHTFSHFYHVGATEALRNAMEEALVIKKGYEAIAINTG